MDFDFIAIDFETANNKMNSACALGIVAVKNLEIIETEYFLICPPSEIFDDSCIAIHGITYDEVIHKPKFSELWSQIKKYFDGNYIIAHNVRFDMSVLKNSLIEYNLEIPDFKYLCSIPISTKACSGLGIGNSLKERTQYFGIVLNNHHNALEDATACAQLVIETVKRCRKKSFRSFIKVYSSIKVKEFKDLKPQEYLKGKKRFEKISISEIAATTEDICKTHSLFGKSMVFTGELSTMERKAAMQKAVNAGAILKSGVSRKTDYLVVGAQDKSIVGDDGLSSKEEKAYKLIDEGYDIKIINEEEFITLLKKT